MAALCFLLRGLGMGLGLSSLEYLRLVLCVNERESECVNAAEHEMGCGTS